MMILIVMMIMDYTHSDDDQCHEIINKTCILYFNDNKKNKEYVKRANDDEKKKQTLQVIMMFLI